MNTESDNIQTTINNTELIDGGHMDQRFEEQAQRGQMNAATASPAASGAAKIVTGSDGYFDCETVKGYLKARLREIRKINRISSASSFSTIMTYIGFLSMLRYGGNLGKDALNYTKFCNEHLKELKCIKKKFGGNGKLEKRDNRNDLIIKKGLVNTWGEILYSMVRCGLVHGMTVVGRNPKQNQVRIYLTHAKLKDAKTEKFKINGKPIKVVDATDRVEITISAHDLLDAVGSALDELFLDKDFEANAIAYLKKHPVIVALGKDAANAASGLSAIYKKNGDRKYSPQKSAE